MKIVITDRLPEGVGFQMFGGHGHEPLFQMIRDEGMGQLVEPVFTRARQEAETDPGPWNLWEGYYREHEDGRRTMVIIGVAYDHGTFFTRAFRVKDVSLEKRKAVEQALGTMMREYLESLQAEMPKGPLKRKGKPTWPLTPGSEPSDGQHRGLWGDN
jgi:hypothetical protein